MRENGGRMSKTKDFFAILVPEFVLRSVLTTCFATFGRFSKRSKMFFFLHAPPALSLVTWGGGVGLILRCIIALALALATVQFSFFTSFF